MILGNLFQHLKKCLELSVQAMYNSIKDIAMNKVTIKELLNNNGLLLPDVHDLFSSFANEVSQDLDLSEKIDLSESKLVTSGYILSNLTVNLKHHIAYYCKIKKYGTLIYRPSTDLRQTLARSLWQIRTYTKHVERDQQKNSNTGTEAKSETPPKHMCMKY